MKKVFSVTSLAFTIFIISPLFLINTKAAEIRTDKQNVTIDEYIDDDLYVTGETIEINEDVNGDLIATGGQITINDDIYGNAIIGGGIVTIKGDVRGSIFCGSGQVTVDGNVGEDINIGAGRVTINGNVNDDVRIGAGTVNINSEKIGGDIFVGASSGKVSDDTEIQGDQQISIGPKDKKQAQIPSIKNIFTQRSITRLILNLLRKAAVLLGWLIVGFLLFKFAPVKSRRITDILTDKNSSTKSLLVGFAFLLSLILLIPILLVLVFIGIGQPIFQLFIALLYIAVTIGGIYSATAITRMVIRSVKNKKYNKYFIPMIIGVTIYQLLGWIPCCIGLTAKLIITTWGIGGILMTKWEMIQADKKS